MSSIHLKLPSGRASMQPALGGANPAMPRMGEPDADDQDADRGDGTQLSGYATPDKGPFECDNCVHFVSDGTAPKDCDHPKVEADPEVDKVDPKGCCNFFKSKGGQNGEQAQQGNEPGQDESGNAAAITEGGSETGGYA